MAVRGGVALGFSCEPPLFIKSSTTTFSEYLGNYESRVGISIPVVFRNIRTPKPHRSNPLNPTPTLAPSQPRCPPP